MSKAHNDLRHYCFFMPTESLLVCHIQTIWGSLIPHLCEHSGCSDQIKSKLGHQINDHLTNLRTGVFLAFHNYFMENIMHETTF